MRKMNLLALMCIVIYLVACDNVKVKMASDNKDEITVTGADGKKYSSYRTACSNGDFDAAREFIEKMKAIQTDAYSNRDFRKHDALSESIREAEEYIFSSELNALASLNDTQANTRIILILNEIKTEGIPVNEGTNVVDLNFWNFQEWVSNFNLRCDRILDIAIACGNKDLAERILRLFRQDVTYREGVVHYINDSKDAAQKKYDEAVRSGAFN